MNVNQNINKLLYALKQKEKIYKINSFKYYNKKKDMYSEKYQILKKELVEVYNKDKEKIEIQERYKLKEECYNKIEIMKFLAEELKKGSETDGK